jgi:hypothetical protein
MYSTARHTVSTDVTHTHTHTHTHNNTQCTSSGQQNQISLKPRNSPSQFIPPNTNRYVFNFPNAGRYSAVGIATRYGLDGPGIEYRWRRDFPHPSRRSLGPPSLLYNAYRIISGRGFNHPPHLVPMLKKE